MRAFLRAEGDTLGFALGLSLIVAGVALLCVPGALIVAGLGIGALSLGLARNR